MVSGLLSAVSVQTAETILSAQGMIPIKITEKTKPIFSQNTKKIKNDELILFSKQFKSMFKAGIPIIRIFEVMESQSISRYLKKTISEIKEAIKAGESLSEAIKKHTHVFSPLYCSMIGAGETSGAIPEVLDRLTYILEHEHKIKSNIKSALQYPKIVVIALVAAFLILLTFVIPKFATMFAATGMTLPLPTRIAMGMYAALKSYWHIMIMSGVGIFMGLKFYFKTEEGCYVKDSFLLRLPVLGELFTKAAMSRFASILSIMLASGMPIMSALPLLAGTIGNSAIARIFKSINTQILEGRGISGPLAAAKFFPSMVVNMVAIGEESGNLEAMLNEVSKHYDEEVDRSVSQLSDLIVPVLTIVLAVIVGFFALAIYMPMWDMAKMAKQTAGK